MNRKSPSARLLSRMKRARRAFTLVELLAVVAIMVLMMAFIGPVVSSIKGGRDVISNAYGIAGALEQARTYAIANNTYAWVGFFEENGNDPWKSTLTGTGGIPGTGRVIMSVVASKNGNRYNQVNSAGVVPSPFGTGTSIISLTSGTSIQLVQVSRLEKFDGIHIGEFNNGQATDNHPERPAVAPIYQVGASEFTRAVSTSGTTTFRYPLIGTTFNYIFTKIIEFNPRGEVNKVIDGLTMPPPNWIEIAIQPVRGNVIEKRFLGTKEAAAVVLINGPTGKVEVIKP